MITKKSEIMSRDELASIYIKHFSSLNMTLADCINAASGCDDRLGKLAAKVIVNFNKMACLGIAELYLDNELSADEKADLFKYNSIKLDADYRVE